MTETGAPQELIAFLDANIVLEGRPVSELPWTDLASQGLIRVLIVPKAMEEIDAKKRDGRLAPIARAFNRLIAPSVTGGGPVVLREADPRVELRMATCSRIPWDDYDELDPADGDGRIVAEALNVRDVASPNRVLVSHDIKPLAYASGRGLPVHQASDAWLRDPEPGPKDREIERQRQIIAELRKDEPTFSISISVSDFDPPMVVMVADLDETRTEALVAAIRRHNPRKPNHRYDGYSFAATMIDNSDSSYDGKYSDYSTKRVPAFAAHFPEKLALLFNQRLLAIRVVNAGKIRADHLVVTVTTSGGWINERVIHVSPDGPLPPVPRPDHLRNFDLQRNLMRNAMPRQTGRHEFETTLPARRGRRMEATCEDFRSGQEYEFEGVVVPTPEVGPLVISVSLTASNLRGERSEVFKVEKLMDLVDAADLVDMDTLKPKVPYPTEPEINRLFDAERYGEVELDGRSHGS